MARKMSKRRDPVSVVDYAGMGFPAGSDAQIIWHVSAGAMVMPNCSKMGEFVEWFSLEAVSPSPARFNKDKLLWLNQQTHQGGRQSASGRVDYSLDGRT
jgi:glutamyl-tRNA synthetase